LEAHGRTFVGRNDVQTVFVARKAQGGAPARLPAGQLPDSHKSFVVAGSLSAGRFVIGISTLNAICGAGTVFAAANACSGLYVKECVDPGRELPARSSTKPRNSGHSLIGFKHRKIQLRAHRLSGFKRRKIQLQKRYARLAGLNRNQQLGGTAASLMFTRSDAELIPLRGVCKAEHQ